MYHSFYNLEKEPFNVTPDPDFLFLSPTHKEALAALAYGIDQRKGFIAITGEIGVGKTTIIRSFLQSVYDPASYAMSDDESAWTTICGQYDQKQVKIIYVFHANVSFLSLLKFICRELEIPIDKDNDPFELVTCLHETLVQEYSQDRNVVVIVDEAQNMPTDTLENLRMLSNLETSKDKLIQIVLVGQPELDRMLDRDGLRQLKQRIAIRCKIHPLNRKESADYIEHRLSGAGSTTKRIFSNEALELIIKHSGGIPRMINIICHNSLISGVGLQKRPVTPKIVREAVADMSGKERRVLERLPAALISLLILLIALLGTFRHDNLLQTVRFRAMQVIGILKGTPVTSSPGKVQPPVDKREAQNAGGRLRQKLPPPPFDDAGADALQKPEAPAPDSTASVVEKKEAQSSVEPKTLSARVGDNPPMVQLIDKKKVSKEITPARGETDHARAEQKADMVTVVVKKGDNLTNLMLGYYGFVDASVINAIRQSNPQLVDVNSLVPGQQILFPVYSDISRSRK